MNLITMITGRWLAGLMLMLLAFGAQSEEDPIWQNNLRPAYFSDRPIEQSDEILTLKAPTRAEDPAIVPIEIQVGFPQSQDRYIKSITVFIDKNPAPLAGIFSFTPQSGRADLAMRVRVNEYSPVRAIAETNDGKLYMARQFVKASGGCSAPVGSDLESAMARIGKMKFNTRDLDVVGQPTEA